MMVSKVNYTADIQETVIEAGGTERNYWRDLWQSRELFYILSWRDLKVRYKQTWIGVSWSVIRPFLTTVIFTFIFSRIAHLTSPDSTPYVMMVFVGMLPWQFFSNGLAEASNSLIVNSNLITKVYFPRMIIPISALAVGMVDLIISFGMLIIMYVWFGVVPSWSIFFLPLAVFMVFACSLGMSLLLASLNVTYRDFRYIIPFIIQIGLYISPVAFSSSLISGSYRYLYYLNPMVGVIDFFRWSLLGGHFHWDSFWLSIAVILFLLILGVSIFRKMERSFADTI